MIDDGTREVLEVIEGVASSMAQSSTSGAVAYSKIEGIYADQVRDFYSQASDKEVAEFRKQFPNFARQVGAPFECDDTS